MLALQPKPCVFSIYWHQYRGKRRKVPYQSAAERLQVTDKLDLGEFLE